MVKYLNLNLSGGIHIQMMQRQSGIFIGEKNVAIGWSSHGKENSVIGNISGQSNLLLNNISILNDPDLIDTPIDDRDINLSFENPSDENKVTNINLDGINVNRIEQNSSIFLGKGRVNGMDANQKSNTIQGAVLGKNNQQVSNLNLNYDQDMIDAIIDDRDIKIASLEKER
ncbi:hypothetical protein [Bacillus sp. USDA818B3_A]|uniref:hypothetical protein n=1 Tax=Bacillus sp. USDA818B3_A TaxID=2698834 RepID=UPI00136BE1AC|nr:hypothetical protein [Bacillus sp. USDA818B3_A]